MWFAATYNAKMWSDSGICVMLRLNSTVENINLTSCPPMLTLYLKHSYRKVMQAVFSSVCCIKVTTIRWMWLGFHVRCYMPGQPHWCMLCACVCMWTAVLHLFAANTASLNLPATHGSSQNEIILHHGVGMWKANLQPGSAINRIISKTSLPICYQNKLILTMERNSQKWMHMQANSVI